MNNKVARFGDDTILFTMVKTKAECEELLKGLFKLDKWMVMIMMWHLRFNVSVK